METNLRPVRLSLTYVLNVSFLHEIQDCLCSFKENTVWVALLVD